MRMESMTFLIKTYMPTYQFHLEGQEHGKICMARRDNYEYWVTVVNIASTWEWTELDLEVQVEKVARSK